MSRDPSKAGARTFSPAQPGQANDKADHDERRNNRKIKAVPPQVLDQPPGRECGSGRHADDHEIVESLLALIFQGDFERANEWADHAAEIPNRQYLTLAHKAVALAGLSRIDEARRTLKATLAEQPAFSISFPRRKLYFVRDEEQSRDIWTA